MTVADDRNGVAVALTYRNNVVAEVADPKTGYYIIYLSRSILAGAK